MKSFDNKKEELTIKGISEKDEKDMFTRLPECNHLRIKLCFLLGK
jgi:hypothetical protein